RLPPAVIDARRGHQPDHRGTMMTSMSKHEESTQYQRQKKQDEFVRIEDHRRRPWRACNWLPRRCLPGSRGGAMCTQSLLAGQGQQEACGGCWLGPLLEGGWIVRWQ